MEVGRTKGWSEQLCGGPTINSKSRGRDRQVYEGCARLIKCLLNGSFNA